MLDVVTRIAALVRSREPACGTTRVVAIDGPSGSGKSTLADRVAAHTGAAVLRLEDLYRGWHGLDSTGPIVRDVLARIAVGEAGTAHRWDWSADRPGEELTFPPVPLLILDGVGSGARLLRPFLSLLVWIDGPAEVRRRRAIERDGDTYAPWWETWAEQERRHFAREGTFAHADCRVAMDD